jgi:hypothetical protein
MMGHLDSIRHEALIVREEKLVILHTKLFWNCRFAELHLKAKVPTLTRAWRCDSFVAREQLSACSRATTESPINVTMNVIAKLAWGTGVSSAL